MVVEEVVHEDPSAEKPGVPQLKKGFFKDGEAKEKAKAEVPSAPTDACLADAAMPHEGP